MLGKKEKKSNSATPDKKNSSTPGGSKRGANKVLPVAPTAKDGVAKKIIKGAGKKAVGPVFIVADYCNTPYDSNTETLFGPGFDYVIEEHMPFLSVFLFLRSLDTRQDSLESRFEAKVQEKMKDVPVFETVEQDPLHFEVIIGR